MIRIIFSVLMCLILSSCYEYNGTSYNIIDFGVIANSIDSASTNTERLNSLIRRLPTNADIYFPVGTYYFDGGFTCRNKTGISFVGDNADFVNTGYSNSDKPHSGKSGFFNINNCNNITISDINLDYFDYCNIYGEITESTLHTLKIRLSEKYLSNSSHTPITGEETAFAVNQLKTDGVSVITDTYFNKSPETSFDKETMVYTISAAYECFSDYTAGNMALVRFSQGKHDVPSIMLENVDGFTLKNVNSYSSPSATVYGVTGISDCNFDNFNVMPKNTSEQIWASNVDGIHLKNVSGYVKLSNSSFIGMGDDALNVNSRAAKITDINGSRLKIKDGYTPNLNLPKNWAKQDDVLRFYNSSWELKGSAKVVSFYGSTLVLDEEVTGIDSSCYIQNTRYIPQITIDNTVVDGSRARAFLLRSENVSVTDCTIKNIALSGIIMAGDIVRWFEMGPTNNAVIQNNSFFNCCCEGSPDGYGVISIKGCDDTGGTSYSAGVHKNITIAENIINSCTASAVYANAVSGIKITDNSITDTLPVQIINCDKVDYSP